MNSSSPTFLLALTLGSLALTPLQNLAQSTNVPPPSNVAIYEPYTFITVAGRYGIADGTGREAGFVGPKGVAVDGIGNLYVADYWNNTIRKVSPTGVVTTLAGTAGSPGSADGIGSAAQFNNPHGLALDSFGNVYVGDSVNGAIRKVTPTGVVTTLAGPAPLSSSPRGVAVDSAGNVYFTDSNTVRKVTPAGEVTTLAGLANAPGSSDGPGSVARFSNPQGVAVDVGGNLYVADTGNNTIRKVTSAGMVTTLAGVAGNVGGKDGIGSDARFNSPTSVAVDNAGNLYVSEAGGSISGNNTIRKVTPSGAVTTLAGLAGSYGSTDGTGGAARFYDPYGVAVDNAGNVYVADTDNNIIRKGIAAVGSPVILIQPQGRILEATADFSFSVLVNGTPPMAYQWRKNGADITSATNLTYTLTNAQLADAGSYSVVSSNPLGRIVSADAIITIAQSTYEPYTFITVAGGPGSAVQFNLTAGVAVDSAGNLYVSDLDTIRKVTVDGMATTLGGGGTAAEFSQTPGLTVDSAGDVYVADLYNNAIRKVTAAGVVTTLAGGTNGYADGPGSAAKFYFPSSVAVDNAGNVYVADSGNNAIRKVTPAGMVTTLAGFPNKGSVDGTGAAARFNQPWGIAVDGGGNVYVAEAQGTIRKVTPAGVVTTLAGLAGSYGTADGTGTAARFSAPYGLTVDSVGNVYVADTGNSTIRKVTPFGVVTTLAGLPGGSGGGAVDGTGIAARFNGPWGMAVDSAGVLYVADQYNNTIRKGVPAVGPAVLLVRPDGQTLAASYDTTLKALANGAVPLTYQWRKDGVDIVGATNVTYGITNMQSTDGGAYTVVVSNRFGSVTSSNAVMTVTPPYTFSTLAGAAGSSGNTDGTGNAARFNYPNAVAVDGAGNVYVADTGNNAIRKVTAAGVLTTVAAGFASPQAVAVDSAGNVYVADSNNSTIRKVTQNGVVTILAGQPGIRGSTDGIGGAAQLNNPQGIAVDGAGDVYVADTYNNTIRKVTSGGLVTTLAGDASITNQFGSPLSGSADGAGNAAQFNYPRGIAVDSAGNLYVADTYNNTIRKVTPVGVVTTLAGQAGNRGATDGTGSAARFANPLGVATDNAGNVYVADTYNGTIRKVAPTGVVTTLAGQAGISGSADGTGSAARFAVSIGTSMDPSFGPSGIAVDAAGNLYVADTGNSTIRKGFPAQGPPVFVTQPQSQTVSVTYPVSMNALVNGAGPLAYQWRKDGTNIAGATNATYTIATTGDRAVGAYSVVVSNVSGTITSSVATLAVTFPPYTFTTLAGLAGNQGSANGTWSTARFNYPGGVASDSAGNVYVADIGNGTIRKVTPTGVVTTLAGLAGSHGSADGTGSDARFSRPFGVTVDSADNVYVADTDNSTIRKVTPTGLVTTLAGLAGNRGSTDGVGSNARFNDPVGVAVDSAGNVYVADESNHTVRKVTPLGVVTTLSGLASIFPVGVAVDNGGNVYVADYGDQTIRRVTPTGEVRTLAGQTGSAGNADGTGSDARFNGPQGLAVDTTGNVYVADTGNGTIRKVTPAGIVTTLAGSAGSYGSADGTGNAARFYGLQGIAVDSAGNLYVADTANNTIRKGYAGYPPTMLLPSGRSFSFSGGQFNFNLTGTAGQSVVIEASTDLKIWLPLQTNTFTGTLNFTDPQSTGVSKHFYRAHVP